MLQPTTESIVSKPMLEKIIAAACQYFGVTENDLRIKKPAWDIVYARNVCFYLIKENVIISQERIAQRFSLAASQASRGIDTITAHKNIYAQTLHDINNVMALANKLAG